MERTLLWRFAPLQGRFSNVMHKNNINKTLFGLRTVNDIKIKYNVGKMKIENIEGIDVLDDEVECSETKTFNVPSYISINGIPYFPTKYEFFNSEHIYYTSKAPPHVNVRIKNDDLFNERAKIQRYTIDLKKLILYNKKRQRVPSQKTIMGESANQHAQRLIDQGILIISPGVKIQWHWGHLLAFSMLPTERAQKKGNLFCCTSACNGHMANIEQAVKLFVYEHKRPLSLELTATYLGNTHLARRVRYRVYEKKSGMCISEYFEALTDVFSDYADYEVIYNKLNESYIKALEFKKKQ